MSNKYNEKFFHSFLIFIIFFFLIIMSLGMQYFSIEVNNLEEKVTTIEEDLQIHKDVFSSYLNNTLSKDIGGE